MNTSPLISLAEARKELRALKSVWSKESLLNTRMLLRACERLEEIAASLRRIPRKYRPSPYNKFFSAGMKRGQTPRQIADEWRMKKAVPRG